MHFESGRSHLDKLHFFRQDVFTKIVRGISTFRHFPHWEYVRSGYVFHARVERQQKDPHVSFRKTSGLQCIRASISLAAFHMRDYYLDKFEQDADVLLELIPGRHVEISICKQNENFLGVKEKWEQIPNFGASDFVDPKFDWTYDLGPINTIDFVSPGALRAEFRKRAHSACQRLKDLEHAKYLFGEVLLIAFTLNDFGFEPFFMPKEKIPIARTLKNICISAVTSEMFSLFKTGSHFLIKIQNGLVLHTYIKKQTPVIHRMDAPLRTS